MQADQSRPIYVIGHKNPDTDAICSAIGYADLKRRLTGGDYKAVRCGHLNDETKFVLSKFGVKAPEYVKDIRTQVMDMDIKRLPGALSKKYDATVFHGVTPGTGFDVLTNCSAQSISTGSPARGIYKTLVAADTAIATGGYDLDGFALSPQARGVLLEATDTTGRPIFINTIAEGGIPRLLGQPAYYSRGLYDAGNAASGTSGSSG